MRQIDFRKRIFWFVLALNAIVWLGAIGWGIVSPPTLIASAASAQDAPLITGTKSASSDVIFESNALEYQIVVHNGGSASSQQPMIVDPLDRNLVYVPGSARVEPDLARKAIVTSARAITFTLWPVRPDETITLSFRVSVGLQSFVVGNRITNTALISDGVNPITMTNSVVVTMSDAIPPMSQILVPDNAKLVTDNAGTILEVRGVAWYPNTQFYPNHPYLLPITYESGDPSFKVEWTAVTSAKVERYLLQVSEDRWFTAPDTACDQYAPPRTSCWINVDELSPGTYYYRARAFDADQNYSRWSNTQSLTIGAGGTVMVASIQAQDQITLQFSISNSAWVPVPTAAFAYNSEGWWDWAFGTPLPRAEDADYPIRVRAGDAYGNFGEPDTITVTIRNGIKYIYLPLVSKRWPPMPKDVTLSVKTDNGFGDYTLGWSYEDPSDPYKPTRYELQEASDAEFTDITLERDVGNVLEYGFSKISSGTYYYRVRGVNANGKGSWSNVVSVDVLRIPDITLSLISDDTFGDYTLGWSYTPVNHAYPPTSYWFQEATDADFTSLTINEFRTSTQYSFSNKAAGTYYYRVAAINAYGEGAWSNVVSVEVKLSGYYDDFSDANSGWPRHVFKVDDRDVLSTLYEGGTYRLKILLDPYGRNNKRMGVVPAPYVHQDSSYDVEVKHWFIKADDQEMDPYAGKAGLVFGGVPSDKGYFSTLYVVEWNFEGECAVSRYSDVDSYLPIVWLPERRIYMEWGSCPIGAGYDARVHALVHVRDDYATIYLNGTKIGTFEGIGGAGYVGLMTGSWERTPVESKFDEFRVREK